MHCVRRWQLGWCSQHWPNHDIQHHGQGKLNRIEVKQLKSASPAQIQEHMENVCYTSNLRIERQLVQQPSPASTHARSLYTDNFIAYLMLYIMYHARVGISNVSWPCLHEQNGPSGACQATPRIQLLDDWANRPVPPEVNVQLIRHAPLHGCNPFGCGTFGAL